METNNTFREPKKKLMKKSSCIFILQIKQARKCKSIRIYNWNVTIFFFCVLLLLTYPLKLYLLLLSEYISTVSTHISWLASCLSVATMDKYQPEILQFSLMEKLESPMTQYLYMEEIYIHLT